MFCAISGECPKEPVVSKKTGHIFEKSLILKYIDDQGKDPITGADLSVDDLLDLQMANKIVRPKPPTVNSIPTLLSLFQNEWDALVLETHQLKSQYHSTRQELSNALYENDAAKRVIARLVKERDEARTALASVKPSNNVAAAGSVQAAEAMDIDEAPEEEKEQRDVSLPKYVVDEMDEISSSLLQVRRKRKAPETLTSPEDISTFQEVTKVTSGHSSITSMDLLTTTIFGDTEKQLLLLGGKDGKINVRDLSIEDNSSTLLFNTTKAHTKGVSSLIWGATPSAQQGISPGIFFSGGVDSTVKVWGIEENAKHKFTASTLHDFNDLHQDEVSGLSVHASGRYLASCSKDSSWALSDVEKGTVISKNACADVEGGFSALHFHPDGLILGAGGNDSKIRIFDVKTQSTAITFEGHVGAISSMNFSENGYYLASSSLGEEIVRVWDLRKCACLAEIPIELSSKSSPGKKKGAEAKIGKVEFNYSGSYLGVAVGSEVRVFANKKWNELVSLRSTSGEVSGFKFGKDCRSVISSGYDGKLIVYGKAE